MAGRGNKHAAPEKRGTSLQRVRTTVTRFVAKKGQRRVSSSSSSSSSNPPRNSFPVPRTVTPSQRITSNAATPTPSQRITSNTAAPTPSQHITSNTAAPTPSQRITSNTAAPTSSTSATVRTPLSLYSRFGMCPPTFCRTPVALRPSISTATRVPIGVFQSSTTSRIFISSDQTLSLSPAFRVSSTPSNSRATLPESYSRAPRSGGSLTPAPQAPASKDSRSESRRNLDEQDGVRIDQNLPRQLGIRVVENNANATAPAAGASASASANNIQNCTLFQVITPSDVHIIYQIEQHFTVLLIDSRTPEKFNESKLKYSVNAAFDPTNVSKSDARFNLKSDVVKFLQANCPSLIGVLNASGFYKNVIIYDDASTVTKQTRSVEILIGALAKWNTDTGTKIRLLEGGFEAMALGHQRLLCCAPAAGPAVPAIWTFPRTIRSLNNYSSIPCAPQQSSHQVIDRLTTHVNNLDTSAAKTEKISNLKRKLKSMEAVKSALQEEDAAETWKRLEPLVSDNVKCPICYEILTGQIIQCLNGHCFCQTCTGRLEACPECRVSFSQGRVRSLGMERMISNNYKVHCPYSWLDDHNGCNEEMLLNDIKAHLGSCVNRPKSGEVQTTENEMDAGLQEIGRLNAELGDINKIIMETEQEINSRGIDQLVPGVDPKLMEKLFENYIKSTKARMAVILETFMKQNNHTE